MAHSKPGHTGDQAHLTWGSVRWSIARAMRIVVITHEGPPPAQYVALLAGHDVSLTADQVRGLVPPDRRPLELDEHAVWLLRGDDELTGRVE